MGRVVPIDTDEFLAWVKQGIRDVLEEAHRFICVQLFDHILDHAIPRTEFEADRCLEDRGLLYGDGARLKVL